MEFIKHNQFLRIRVAYDCASGQSEFQDFVEMNDISCLNHREWLKIGDQSAPHYTATDLKHDDWVIEELLLLRHVIGSEFMPALTPEEGEELFDQVREEDWDSVNFDTARRGLLSVNHLDWYAGVSFWDDISAELEPYLYTATGYSQGDWAHLYLIGMPESEAESLVREFETYAYDTPYRYGVKLIDCDIVPDGFQFLLRIPTPLDEAQCRRMTEVFAMLGKPNLRAVCDGTSSRVQGLVRGRPSRYQILKSGVTFGVYV